MQINNNKYTAKMERLKSKAQRQESRRGSMPSIVAIAEYWCPQEVFAKLLWDCPACFACGFDGSANGKDLPIRAQWERSKLERCHLIAHAQGGTSAVQNLALLCARCHHEAPMIGLSPQPMIDWINRREHYCSWLVRRVFEECRGISPTLPQDCAALGFDVNEFVDAMTAMSNFLKIGYHPGGDMIATAAQCANGVVQLQAQIRSRAK